MPQISKGGKFVFGISVVNNDLSINIPPQAIEEYDIVSEKKVYLFSGSKSTGGFCVTRKGLLNPSKIGKILKEMPELSDYTLLKGKFIKYKSRYYCWTDISENGKIYLTEEMMTRFDLETGTKLLSIRSSDIAFTMGAKGPLLERARNYEGLIEEF